MHSAPPTDHSVMIAAAVAATAIVIVTFCGDAGSFRTAFCSAHIPPVPTDMAPSSSSDMSSAADAVAAAVGCSPAG